MRTIITGARQRRTCSRCGIEYRTFGSGGICAGCRLGAVNRGLYVASPRPLSPREEQVVTLAADGLQNKDIARPDARRPTQDPQSAVGYQTSVYMAAKLRAQYRAGKRGRLPS